MIGNTYGKFRVTYERRQRKCENIKGNIRIIAAHVLRVFLSIDLAFVESLALRGTPLLQESIIFSQVWTSAYTLILLPLPLFFVLLYIKSFKKYRAFLIYVIDNLAKYNRNKYIYAYNLSIKIKMSVLNTSKL